ncbi:MAG: hypothetical protein KQI35_15335 [Bacteroidetes bacterium]|nr:hypothetical protein [Bacteroidota bacterium]
MKKSIKKGESEKTDDLNEKLDKIIEHSRTENKALKKILKGLEVVREDFESNNQKKKTGKNKK